jgi:SAM-dependent methyltransferase
MSVSEWPEYVARFHAQHAGITEQVLGQAGISGRDAYDWLGQAVPAGATVLDLACGSAPVWTRLQDQAYVGVDISDAELAIARRRGARHLLHATAQALPIADGSIDVVTCAMGLQILTPLPETLAEIHRVLRPGGRFIATVPARRPLTVADLAVLTGLLAALGRALVYPNDRPLAAADSALAAAGLRLTADQYLRFCYPLRTRADADLFLASLYLPGLPRRRSQVARAYLRALARVRTGLPIPIRRLIALRPVR